MEFVLADTMLTTSFCRAHYVEILTYTLCKLIRVDTKDVRIAVRFRGTPVAEYVHDRVECFRVTAHETIWSLVNILKAAIVMQIILPELRIVSVHSLVC